LLPLAPFGRAINPAPIQRATLLAHRNDVEAARRRRQRVVALERRDECGERKQVKAGADCCPLTATFGLAEPVAVTREG
jgi:hypothetical protein